MTQLIITFILVFNYSKSFAVNWDDKVKGTNQTLREVIIQRNMINNAIRENQKKKNELNGLGNEFSGPVEISSAATPQEPTKKSYKVYIRGCGKVELNQKSQEEMEKLKPGSIVKLRFTGSRTCQVSDWSLN